MWINKKEWNALRLKVDQQHLELLLLRKKLNETIVDLDVTKLALKDDAQNYIPAMVTQIATELIEERIRSGDI